MTSSVSQRLDAIPRKSLAMRGESPHKRVVVAPETRQIVAQVVERAVYHSGCSKKELAIDMGYGDDQSPLSRWIAGIEPPTLVRLLSVPAMRYGLMVALAELTDAEIRTVVSIRRQG